MARFGGEEFCVVLASDCAFDAEQYAQQMRSKIEQLAIANPVDALCQYLTVSIGGVYAISPKMESYLSLFHQADMHFIMRKNTDEIDTLCEILSKF